MAAAGICLALAFVAIPATGALRGSSFGRSSLAGSGTAVMQLETVPARVSRVVARPGAGGREAWALGTSTARLPGYGQTTSGQVVFLKYSPLGWRVTGPPRSAAGAVINPALGSFDVNRAGAGWAVGDGGVILHKRAGSDQWVEHEQSRKLTQATLTSVSLAPDGGGYASGVGPVVLRLSSGRWVLDQLSPDMTASTQELQAIAAVSATDAWTVASGQVSGVDATSLLIYRRTAVGWSTIKTGQAIFDNPPAKAPSGELNRSTEAGAVAADARGAWIGGRIFPRSLSAPDGDATPGDTSRAFVVRYDNATQRFTSYCADLYSERVAGTDLTRLCDEPFPTAPYHVASLSIVPGGDVFAGGLGLFRFSGDGWYREPNANGYLISVSMASNKEGFVASPGRSLGAGGLIRSSSTTIGHWTASPKPSAVARWSQPQDQLLESVTLAGDGTGRALAVGMQGAGIMFSGAAWDSINSVTGQTLHAVAWPRDGDPWAVGSSGTMLRLRGNEWEFVEPVTSASLFGIAFNEDGEGVAVGLGGTILVYRNGGWVEDSPADIPNDLYAIIATPDGYLAVGKDGAVVEGRPGSWRLRMQARSLLLRAESTQAPTLYAATLLGDRVVIGGQDSSLIVREAGGALRIFPSPLQGTILALAAKGTSLYASVSPNDQKYRGEAPSAQRGTLMRLAGGLWSDIGLSRRVTLLRDRVDPSKFEDPMYALAMSDAGRGWGAGGSPADLKDQTDGQFRSQVTGAIYRVAYGEDPKQPASAAPLPAAKPGVSFAAFGESWCGTGLCSSAVGTGTMADEVALQIREEINTASEQPGGPRFVLFTGNMRRTGIPEELEQFRNYIKGFRIPFFAAVGSTDRFTGFDVNQATGQPSAATTGSHDYWKSVFGSMQQPWGQGKKIPGFDPVTGVAQAPAGLARTHYAFDYTEQGRKLLRVVVVDSSTKSYGTATEQTPQEEQGSWLKGVLAEASDVLRIPAVVVMNQPTILPSDQQIPNWTTVNEQQDFETTMFSTRVSAVITGGPRMNGVDLIKNLVPMLVVGGGGAPLGRESATATEPPTKLPSDGYYHAWRLLRIDPNDRPLPLIAQARIYDQAFPVVETLAMHSFRGYQIPAGTTTDISALARLVTGGFSDPDQAKAAYLFHGSKPIFCGNKAQGNGICISGAARLPEFKFYSDDPSMADFVKRDALNAALPDKVGKQLFPDPGGAEGLLCVFDKLGRVGINAVAGLHRARIVIEVTPGTGRCLNGEGPRPPTPPPTVPPSPGSVPDPVRKRAFFFARGSDAEVAAVAPPPPAPVVAPAPPGAPGVGRKEEHEIEVEKQGHDDSSAFTAISHARRAEQNASGVATPMLIGAVMMAFFGAVAAATHRERRIAAERGRAKR